MTTETRLPPRLDATAPSLSAVTFLKQRDRRLIFWRDDFYEWIGTHYDYRDDNEIRKEVREFCDCAVTEGGGPFKATIKKVAEIRDAIDMQSLVPARFDYDCRISNGEDSGRTLIACRNGRLDIASGELLPHDPDWLVTSSLPFDHDPMLSTPTRWLEFLSSLWPDDDGQEGGSIEALQEMLGYLLSGSTTMQKIFLLIGPPRSGKGTIAWIIERLVGKRNYVGMPLANLAQGFGMQGLVGKTVMVMPDVRSAHASSSATLVERLLNISGEDSISINRKYKDDWCGVLPARIVILTNNEVPRLPDSTGVIATRFVPLKMTESFIGKEDLTLKTKLEPELAQIFNWALEGLRRLTARGHFVVPDMSEIVLDDIRTTAAPHLLFFEEWLIYEPENPEAYLIKTSLYDSYRRWCDAGGYHPFNDGQFAQRLRASFPGLEDCRPRDENGTPQRCWRGLRRRLPDEYHGHPIPSSPFVYNNDNIAASTQSVLPKASTFIP